MTGRETIFALSSGAGRAAIAVLRISGPAAQSIVAALAGPCPPPRRFAVRTLRTPDGGEAIDKAGVIWLPAPATATGEDMAEFHIHGSEAVASHLFRVLSGFDGVRLAEPGEFTRRGFINGKLDLVEAEGTLRPACGADRGAAAPGHAAVSWRLECDYRNVAEQVDRVARGS